jgi:broad specificity phosphatase PhoE
MLAMTQRVRRLVLVRHGETVGQSSIRYFGSTDVDLSLAGFRQMEQVRTALAGEVFEAVYTSMLQRTIRAARIISPQIPPQIVAGFNEVNFGDWEGLTREEIEARDPVLFRQWRAALSEFTYPGGDAAPAFRARVAAALRALLPAAPERVLVVAHRGVIATIVAELLRLSTAERAAWPIDLASIHVLEATNGTWRATLVNERRHLSLA